MQRADRTDVKDLAAETHEWCVSVFVPPHPAGAERGADRLRLKNLLATAQRELVSLGVRKPEAARLVDGTVVEELQTPTAAEFHTGGFALFLADDVHEVYRIGMSTQELVAVSRRFHLRPLIGEFESFDEYWVLALTRKRAAALRFSDGALEPVTIEGLPDGLDAVVEYTDREPILTSHGSARSGTGGVVAAFHGQGGTNDQSGEDLLRYMRLVDEALRTNLSSQPLVVLGSLDLVAMFRDVTGYEHVIATETVGNADKLAAAELGERAEACLAASRVRRAEECADRFLELHGTGLASDRLDEILAAAHEGRVGRMLASRDDHIWGRFEPGQTPAVHAQREAGDEDLIDTAAAMAWQQGAEVHVVGRQEMPGEAPLAAVYRY